MQTTQFKKWSPDEEQKVLTSVQNNKPIAEIALEHGRSKRAIELRLADIAVKLHNNGFDDEYIYNITKITKPVILKRIEDINVERISKNNLQSQTFDIASNLKEISASLSNITKMIEEIKSKSIQN